MGGNCPLPLSPSVPIESANGNKYFYDLSGPRLLLCHPLLFHVISLAKAGKNLSGWLSELGPDPIDIPDLGRFSRSQVEYYCRKYQLLRENGYFKEIDNAQRVSAELQARDVESYLVNTKQVTFEVTERCNLECEYCAYGRFYTAGRDQRKGKDLDFAVARTALDYVLSSMNSPLNRAHDKEFDIGFYGGEPLLNFRLIARIVDYVDQLDPQHNHFTFSMTTNGLLLSKYMDFLVERDFRLLISLDGDRYNNSYRVLPNGKNSFDLVVRNVEALRSRHPDYFSRRVKFNALMHNRNSVGEIFHFFRERYGKKPMISEVSPAGILPSMREEFRSIFSSIRQSLAKTDDAADIEREMFIDLPEQEELHGFIDRSCGSAYNTLADLAASGSNEQKPFLPTATCPPFERRVFITVKGEILPCERIHHEFSLGKVTAERVFLDPVEIAKRYNEYYANIRKNCSECYVVELCPICMFHLDIEVADCSCPGFSDESGFSNSCASLIDYLENQPELYMRMLKEVGLE
jgi:uncharacterized protein